MADEIIRCSSCGQANRVPSLDTGQKAVCGRCKSPLVIAGSQAADGHPIPVTDADFASRVARGSFVVDFWAAWCGPCRTIAPVIEALAAERKDVTFAKLNVDENPATQARFRVSGIPTLIFFRDGQETGRLVGAAAKPQIENAIRQYLS